MKLGNLCAGVKPSCPNLRSREKFIDGLFEAAGGKPYISVSYKRGLCNGTKAFVEEQKIPLRGKDNVDSLTNFFIAEIADQQVPDVIAVFGIPETGLPDKRALCRALASQMKLLIEEQAEDVSNIIAIEYQKAKNTIDTAIHTSEAIGATLYPGDNVYLTSAWNATYEVGCDEEFQHTWCFDNIGKQTWSNRRLYFSNHEDVRPRAESNYIDIPETPPGKSVKITTRMNPRGFEKRSECLWIMIDKDGTNCFPHSGMFTIIVDASFQMDY